MDTLLLSIVTFVPAMAALILLVVARGEDAAAGLVAKRFALVATTATFIISLFILWQFDPSDTSFQMVEEADWLLGLKYKLGVDGISILFVMLTLGDCRILGCEHARQRIYDRVFAVRNVDAGRVYGA